MNNNQPRDIKYEVERFEWEEREGKLVLKQTIYSEKEYSIGQAEQLRQEWIRQAQQNRARNTEEQILVAEKSADELEAKAKELTEVMKPLVDEQAIKTKMDDFKKQRSKKK